MPQGMRINNGSTQLNANFDTGIYPVQSTGGPIGLNSIGGTLHIASGFPITGGNFGIGNNLGIGIIAEDDMPPDSTGLGLGFTMNGFLTQIGIASGKTMDSLTFMGAGAQNAVLGNGTFNEINLFRAIGILPGAGATINNLYGFKIDALLSAASPTNVWGFFCDDINAENYLGKSLAIGTSSKKVSNVAIGFEVDQSKNTYLGKTQVSGAYVAPTNELEVHGTLGLVEEATGFQTSFRSATGLMSSTSYVLPATDGSVKQVLTTDGAGNLSWTNGGSIYDLPLTSFVGANNQSSPVDVTDFVFANANVRSFEAQVSVTTIATAELYEEFEIKGIQRNGDWQITSSSTGDDDSVAFSITNAGQVQYISKNNAGFTSLKMEFRALVTEV